MGVLRPVREALRRLSTRYDRYHYRPEPFVLIANNCFGGEVYQRFGLPYNSPFVGLFVPGPDFVRLLADLDGYLAQPLRFPADAHSEWRWPGATYPLGLLGDVEIHFVHYASAEEAAAKWYRRKDRLLRQTDRSRFFYKICDRDGGSPDVLRAFHELPLANKISFGAAGDFGPDHLRVRETDGATVPDGVYLYRAAHDSYNPLAWITSGRIRSDWYSKLKYRLKLV